MPQVSDLIVSEFRQEQVLLYDELLFGARDLMGIQGWRLQDDLDADGVNLSWLDHPGKSTLIDGTELALLRYTLAIAVLQEIFIADEAKGRIVGGLSLTKFIFWRRTKPGYRILWLASLAVGFSVGSHLGYPICVCPKHRS